MLSGGQTPYCTPLPCTNWSLNMQRRSKAEQYLDRQGKGLQLSVDTSCR